MHLIDLSFPYQVIHDLLFNHYHDRSFTLTTLYLLSTDLVENMSMNQFKFQHSVYYLFTTFSSEYGEI